MCFRKLIMDQLLEVLLFLFFPTLVISFSNNHPDTTGLNSFQWRSSRPHNWEGSDPCANWDGITCNQSRVTTIRIHSMGLSGVLSEDIAQLSELEILDLSSNKELTGPLPQSIGNLKKLTKLILVGCNFTGQIPYSIGSLQKLEFLSLNSNMFKGSIPASIGNLSKLTWLDITANYIEGPIPVSTRTSSGLDRLLLCQHLLLDGNKLGGTIPTTLALVPNLSILSMDNTHLTGQIPQELFSLRKLVTVKLKNNTLDGTLDISSSYNKDLKLIDLRSNNITDINDVDEEHDVQILLDNNPACEKNSMYCSGRSASEPDSLYVTEHNNCSPSPCDSNQIPSPNCRCAIPFKGILIFTAIPILDLGNTSRYNDIEKALSKLPPVDSVSLSNPEINNDEYFQVSLSFFPKGKDHFNQTDVLSISETINFDLPGPYRPFYFISESYENYEEVTKESKWSRIGIDIGVAAGVSVIVLLLFVGVYVFFHKRRAGTGSDTLTMNATRFWDATSSSGSVPQLKGTRWFSFTELKKYTNNFSTENEIGSGGYGKVYRGNLPTGEMIAIKRATRGSMQGGIEFKTEIELLSTVHHKNLVRLLGFCLAKGEQMLVYEYVPNGNLKDALSGKSRIRLDWIQRLKVTLDTARGLAYLHELVNPPIIHRDIKSANVLLDNRLNAKVADFGLSKLMGNDEQDHVSTQVKGTMGYLDPEYYMTQQLTEKSDVYSFGVLMLELITARKPIERGVYIVKLVRETMDENKDLYNLHALLDPAIGVGTRLNGFERFVDLAMTCVENQRADRPTMGQVVKEIERISKLVGLNPTDDSRSTSSTYGVSIKVSSSNPYSEESFSMSGGSSAPKIEYC
ncbi:probable leucine-rich repeat receptor-like protein kinase At5g49770 isoform X2 [Humulus lupulus]|uniref:probable leucine-rich repeat receptor-like protein kinase At5g49770 isoform X2 n=1 Tax=Humulus lupulus TaxID=3486 RepID=UPI002B405AC2|nr:probable leucine-rich repeat receptor-like protein kinase At5g49770 isoform X2 [Humulus lupulus]